MQKPFAKGTISATNTFLDVKYSSPDASIFGLHVDEKTGEIAGFAPYTGNFAFYITVSDETTRYTTKPVHITSMPLLRVLVPEQLRVTQGKTLNELASSDYSIGKVTFSKGDGNWPEGVAVTETGAITGLVNVAPGTYDGLTVKATDTITDALSDTQTSNTFSIVVDPSPAKPVIANLNNNKLVFGQVGTAASYTPTVTSDQTGQAWTLSGTTYSLNVDLSAYGLSFDTKTGTISGTPTQSASLDNVMITVSSSNNDSSTTNPFKMLIAPKDAMAFSSTANSFYLHPGFTGTVDLSVKNAVGAVTYTTQAWSATFTVNYNNGDQTMLISSVMSGTQYLTVKVTDDAGRTTSKVFNFTVGALGVTYPSTTLVQNATVTSVNAATAINANGPLTYQFSGLPDGLTFDPTTGAISGTPTTVGTYNAVLTLTDTFDAASKQVIVQSRSPVRMEQRSHGDCSTSQILTVCANTTSSG